MRRENIILIFILLLAAVFRLLFIHTIPTGVNHDQLYYLINAKSFFLTSKDISQTVSLKDVFLFHYPPTDLIQSELPFVISGLTSGFFPFSLTAYTLPNIFLSVLTVVLIFLIAKKLFNIQVALICAAVTAINPWLIFSARIMYEMTPVMFFYLLGFYILLIAKDWKILLSLPVFLLAFYSYIAQKIILVPLLLLFVAYSYFFVHKQKYLKYYLVLIGMTLLFVLFYFFQLSHQPAFSRLSEITTPNSPQIAFQVNEARRLSVLSPINSIVENKFLQYIFINVKLLFETLSPTYLFLTGDYFFSLGNHGLFYLVDIIFVIIGAVSLFLRKKELFFLILTGIFIGTIPQLIHDATGSGGNFSPHITMIIPFSILIIGYGISQSLLLFKKKNYKNFFIIFLVFIYTFSVLQFSVSYFFQLPYKAGLFDFSSRELARYIYLSKNNNKQIVVYARNPRDLFKSYLFYTNEYNKNTVNEINKEFITEKYRWGNILFDTCLHIPSSPDRTKVIFVNGECKKKLDNSYLTLPLLKDGGEVYKIYNDSLCNPYSLGRYVEKLQMKDLDIEKLSTRDFCQKYITEL